MKTLDHKGIFIEKDLPLECIAKTYLDGRKVYSCAHVKDGILPRAIRTTGNVKFSIRLEGDVEHETQCSLLPPVFVCFDCLADFIVANLRSGPDLAADRH